MQIDVQEEVHDLPNIKTSRQKPNNLNLNVNHFHQKSASTVTPTAHMFSSSKRALDYNNNSIEKIIKNPGASIQRKDLLKMKHNLNSTISVDSSFNQTSDMMGITVSKVPKLKKIGITPMPIGKVMNRNIKNETNRDT